MVFVVLPVAPKAAHTTRGAHLRYTRLRGLDYRATMRDWEDASSPHSVLILAR